MPHLPGSGRGATLAGDDISTPHADRSKPAAANVPGEARSATMITALALGSNLGDRLGHLAAAVRGLDRAGLHIERCSSVYGSAPVGYASQPDFLNAVIVGQWSGGAHAVLSIAHGLEHAAGRRRSFPNAPRPLDVDLIFMGNLVLDTPDLVVPHPRWRDRAFVLRPLAEAAPDLMDPLSGDTVHTVWSRRRHALGDTWVEAPPSALWSALS
jgi:2-amino-4-hydroxy-6-hydroxymethyldihydropteridine diphosphokinase